jgi:hypothetical protein
MPRTKPAPEYQAWIDMHRRCYNTEHKNYADYGGRGITVCPRWRAFKAFFDDMGLKPKGYWLERIDNAEGYFPGNCEWVTPKQQARNRRQTRRVLIQGKELCVRDACNMLGINECRVYQHVYMYGGNHQHALEIMCARDGINV